LKTRTVHAGGRLWQRRFLGAGGRQIQVVKEPHLSIPLPIFGETQAEMNLIALGSILQIGKQARG
jgi:hypothetical protein